MCDRENVVSHPPALPLSRFVFVKVERNSHPSLYVSILRLISRKAYGGQAPEACLAGLKNLELMRREVFAVRVLWRKVRCV